MVCEYLNIFSLGNDLGVIDLNTFTDRIILGYHELQHRNDVFLYHFLEGRVFLKVLTVSFHKVIIAVLIVQISPVNFSMCDLPL
jgi:hypothetical protein